MPPAFQAGGSIAPDRTSRFLAPELAEGPAIYRTSFLPLSLAGTSVSFDESIARGQRGPGGLSFASDGQVNVQVPWELAGSSSVTIKVSLGGTANPDSDIAGGGGCARGVRNIPIRPAVNSGGRAG